MHEEIEPEETIPLWINEKLTSENDSSNNQTSITNNSGCLLTLVIRYSKDISDQLDKLLSVHSSELFPKYIPRDFIVLFLKLIPLTLLILFLYAHIPSPCVLFIFNFKPDILPNSS